MNVLVRLGLFAAGLAVVFVLAFGAGRAVGPDEGPAPTTVTTDMPAGHQMEEGS